MDEVEKAHHGSSSPLCLVASLEADNIKYMKALVDQMKMTRSCRCSRRRLVIYFTQGRATLLLRNLQGLLLSKRSKATNTIIYELESCDLLFCSGFVSVSDSDVAAHSAWDENNRVLEY